MNPAARYAAHAPSTAKTTALSKPMFAAEVYEEDEDVTPRGASPSEGGLRASQARGSSQADELARLRAELRGEARALRLAVSRPRVPAELLAELATLRAAVDELMTATPKKGDVVTKTLASRGIEGGAAAALTRIAKKERSGSAGETLRAAAASLVKIAPWPAHGFAGGQTLIALVGPAGVGKTTTAAKLAARARMAKKTVALVSCDAFRVGAMEQLGRYAELMDARFHTATSAEELLEVLANETADVIIVDTAGRAIEADGTEAILGAAELRAPGKSRRRVEVLLCLPASLRAADATRAHRDFASAKPTAICITKIDETDAPSGIAHAAFASRLPVSTLCFGQRVPEDIAPASEPAIAELLFGPCANDAEAKSAQ